MDRKILRNQIISDMIMFGDDYKDLYENNLVDCIKELMRIYRKMADYLKQEILEEKREEDKARMLAIQEDNYRNEICTHQD